MTINELIKCINLCTIIHSLIRVTYIGFKDKNIYRICLRIDCVLFKNPTIELIEKLPNGYLITIIKP